MNQHVETIKHAADATAGLVTVGAIMSYLPPLAAAFTIVWTGIRIYEYFVTKFKDNKKPPK